MTLLVGISRDDRADNAGPCANEGSLGRGLMLKIDDGDGDEERWKVMGTGTTGDFRLKSTLSSM